MILSRLDRALTGGLFAALLSAAILLFAKNAGIFIPAALMATPPLSAAFFLALKSFIMIARGSVRAEEKAGKIIQLNQDPIGFGFHVIRCAGFAIILAYIGFLFLTRS